VLPERTSREHVVIAPEVEGHLGPLLREKAQVLLSQAPVVPRGEDQPAARIVDSDEEMFEDARPDDGLVEVERGEGGDRDVFDDRLANLELPDPAEAELGLVRRVEPGGSGVGGSTSILTL
jgi:hypothetical protein